MCLIIAKTDNQTPSISILRKASEVNPHGLGIFWIDTQEITKHNSEEWQILLNDRPYIAHFRLATIGEVNESNIHPFKISAKKGTFLFQNGTIPNIGDENDCDTKVLAESIKGLNPKATETILKTYNCRFAIVNTKTTIESEKYTLYNLENWHERNGILYSKANCFVETIAVYGTLKKGGSNNYLLNSSKFIGKGKTSNRYRMHGNSIPFVNRPIDNANGHNITIEIYEVDTYTLGRVDTLESHPSWYKREEIPVQINGETVSAWLYFNPKKKTKEEKYLSNFKNKKTFYGYNSYNRGHMATTKQNNFWKGYHKTTATSITTNPEPQTDTPKYCVECMGFVQTYTEGDGRKYCKDCFKRIYS